MLTDNIPDKLFSWEKKSCFVLAITMVKDMFNEYFYINKTLEIDN